MKFFHLLSTGLLGLLLAEQAASAALASHAGKTIKYKGDTYSCKCYEGDSCWPKYAVWQQLNATVGGRLQKVIPPAANCHNTFEGKPTYDAAGCEVTKAGWLTEPWQYV